MKKDKISLRMEVETILDKKPVSEINFCIKMQKLTLFLYKESTIFFFFMSFFIGSFLYFMVKNGPTRETLLIGIIESILYLAFYYGIVKKINPFKNREQEYSKIKDKLDVLIDYRNYRLTQ